MSFLLEKSFGFLVSAVGQIVVDKWREGSQIDNHLDDLRGAVRKGHDLILRSECWSSKKNLIDELLPVLKDAVYEAESIVDELEYQRSKQTAAQSWTGEALAKYFKNWMTGFPKRVKQVQEKLTKICNEMQEACNKEKIPENHNEFDKGARPTTTKYVNATKVIGRDTQLDDVLCLLGVIKRKGNHNSNFEIGESSSGLRKNGNVRLISIVGMGGVGKTTFAQLIYNDTRVKSYFKKLIWVCISDNFDVEWLLKEIIERATTRKYDHATFNTLQETLEEALKLERFLLVLDDAWSEKETDWKNLLDPIREGIEGSTIFVTTRSKRVAEMAAKGMNYVGPIYLECLETKIYWKFFKSQAFGSEVETKCYPELEKIGKEICEKLKGSPLAAITIGSLLKISLDVHHWSTIRDSEMWRLKQEEHHILPVLRLSYQYLPAHLKKCFSFCSLYPKDFKFTKAELSKLWIMHGFINCPKDQQHREQDILAEVYFNELVSRCFFQKAAESCFDEYVIHDLMHDVCQFMAEDECFCLKVGDEKPISPNVCRHLSIFKQEVNGDELNELGKLLSLRVVQPCRVYPRVIKKWCDELTNIRSLSLRKCTIENLPENIGNLKHLTYLDISFSQTITHLPKSFCNLYNLKYLNMEGCPWYNQSAFPKGSEKLVSMQFFHFPSGRMPLDGISMNLAKTIIAKGMAVCAKIKGKELQILKLISVRGSLEIRGLDNVDSKDAAQEAELNRKSSINNLVLDWSNPYGSSYYNHDQDLKVLEGLCPHSNLRELTIKEYGGKLSPSWLKDEFLPNLVKLHLDKCVNLLTISHLPRGIIGITISKCIRLKNLENCLRPEHIPALKRLHISSCHKLMSLPVESFGRFESLKNLDIRHCPKLTCPSNAMVLPSSLMCLDLKSCGDLQKSIPNCLQNLSALERLSLRDMPLLESIPAGAIRNLKSLFELRVEDCADLKSLGGVRVLESLQKLDVCRCPKLEESGGQDIEGNFQVIHPSPFCSE